MQEIIDFIDDNDEVVGTGTQDEAHEKNIPHRSSSIILFDKEGKILLTISAAHKRHAGEYFHSASGHVRSEESYEMAAERELKEELGINVPLEFVTKYYVENSPGGKSFVGLFKGFYDGPVTINHESASFTWMTREEIVKRIAESPNKFSKYLVKGLQEVGFL